MDHVSVVVDDLSAATKFFTALGLKVRGEGTIEGSVVDRIVALEDVLVQMVMVRNAGRARLPGAGSVRPPRSARGRRSRPG